MVKKVESFGSQAGRTTKKITIADCGQLVRNQAREARVAWKWFVCLKNTSVCHPPHF